MRNGGPSKLAGPLRNRLPREGENWADVPIDTGDELPLYVEAEPGRAGQVRRAILDRGVAVRSVTGDYVAADVPAGAIRDLAGEPAVRHLQRRRTPKQHAVTADEITEGLGVTIADSLHDEGITGQGARIAVIDHYFHTENPKYQNNLVATVGDSTYFTTDAEYNSGSYTGPEKQHGTACAEIVADLAPDAELVLATTRGSQTFSQIMSEIESYDPDGATMSLGYYTGLRIDGQDQISTRVDQFTSGGDGRIFATSAGNEADGGHWDGPFVDDGSGLMEFDSSLSEPTRFPVLMDPINFSAEVHVHWDADWSTDNQRYEARLYDSTTASTALDTSRTTDPVEVLELTPAQHGGGGPSTYYVEIENVGATGSEHFDMFNWGRALFDQLFTPERSLGIPATSTDTNTLAVAAVQATGTGVESAAEDLKGYSSQGPTQDGRRGLDVAAPSRVSTTTVGDYGGYGPLEKYPNQSPFNGTSAASPHVGGVIGLLYDADVSATRDERRQAVFDTGRAIADSSVSSPGSNNTKIGFGYVDVEAARGEVAAALATSPSTKWTSNPLSGRAQHNRPAADDQRVYVGGLQQSFVALSVADGTTVDWSFDRGSKAGLSDSSGYRWDQRIFFGSGQGKLYGLNATDASRHWSQQDTPDLGSAVTSSPVVYDSTVYAGTNDGTVYAFDASASATQQWSTSVGGPVYSRLAADATLVYVTTADGDLVVLDAATGNEQWRTSLPAFGASSPALGNGRVYVASDEVYAYDAEASRSQLWASSGFGGTESSGPTYADGTVYVGSDDGDLYAHDAASGSQSWTASTGGAVASAPAVHSSGSPIAVVSTDGTLYLFDDSGTELDTMAVAPDSRASPTIYDGAIYVGSRDGTVHAFE